MNKSWSCFAVVMMFTLLVVSSARANVKQGNWRWRSDTVSESSTGGWKASQNTGVNVNQSETIRLRVELYNDHIEHDSSIQAFELYYSTQTDTVADPDNSEGKWIKITTDGSTNAFQSVSTAHYTHGASASTDHLNETAPANTHNSGGKLVSSGATVSFSLLSLNSYEMEYCIKATANAVKGETYYIIIRRPDYRINDYASPMPSLTIPLNPPVFNSGTAFSVDESVTNTTSVLWDVQADDGDGGANDAGVTYSIEGGTGNSVFAIDSDDGEIRLKTGGESALDREVAASYTLEVQADDGGSFNNTVTQTITVTVNDIAPNISSNQTFSVSETASNGSTVGTVANTGDNDSLTWSFTAGNDSGAFAINGSTGKITVNDTSQIDFESSTTFSLSVKATDGNTGSTETVSINVTNVDEAPTLNSTGLNPNFTEGGSQVSLFSGTSVSTVDAGQDITAMKLDVTNISGDGSQEFIILDGTSVALSAGNTGATSSNNFNYSVALSGGTATVSITKNGPPISYKTLVDNLAYRNTQADVDSNNRVIKITYIKDSGSEGGAGHLNENTALSVSSTVSMINVNDAPTLTTTVLNPSFNEGDSAEDLFSDTYVGTIESGQEIKKIVLTVRNMTDTTEILTIDNQGIALTHGINGTTPANSIAYQVSVSSNTATVTLSGSGGATFPVFSANNLVNGIKYANTSENPISGNRVVTLTSLQDSGGTENGGNDTTSLNYTSTVTVAAVNDAPTLTGLPTDIVAREAESSLVDLSAAAIADVDAGSKAIQLSLTVNSGTLAAVSGGSITVSGSGSPSLILTGMTADLNAYLNDATNIRYTGVQGVFGDNTATLAVIASDNGNSGSGGSKSSPSVTVNIDITKVNKSPTLTGGPYTFASINEDTTSTGVTVAAILSGATAHDLNGDTMGIAITGEISNGDFQYATDSTNGINGTWQPFNHGGDISEANALLLSETTYVRFVPDTRNGETATFTFRAWDKDSGTASDSTGSAGHGDVRAGVTGGTFSDGAASATLTVTDIDDAPVITATGENNLFLEGEPAVSLFSSASLDPVDNGQTIREIVLTIRDIVDGTKEFLLVDGMQLSLENGNNKTTVSGFTCQVGLSDKTSTVTITKDDTPLNYQTLINSLGFRVTLSPFDNTERSITLLSVTDSGLASGDHRNRAENLSIESVVDLSNARINVADIDVIEGDSGTANAVFTVSLTVAGERPITVDAATSDNTAIAGSDYQTLTTKLTFQPGETEKTVTVQIVGDIKTETEEAFNLILSNPVNALSGDNTGVCLIADNDPDTDKDGMSDKWETRYGLDPDNPDDKDADKDGDGIPNSDEYIRGTNPGSNDTDKDGLTDKWEVDNGYAPNLPDTDNNGTPDGEEDPDSDGLTNLQEQKLGTRPDADDTDNDGIKDCDEDPDNDGLTNLAEFEKGTDPLIKDTDGDGLSDKWEIDNNYNPLESDSDGDGTDDGDEDPDEDSVTNRYEEMIGTDPNKPDSNDDGIPDGEEDPDGDGIITLEEIENGLNPGVNEKPEAIIAEPVQTVGEDVPVLLYGSGSSDPDDGIKTWLWEQVEQEGGPDITLSGADTSKARFISPQVMNGGQAFVFKLTVADKKDQTATAECVVNVTFDNNPPTAEAGDLKEADGGTIVELKGIGSDSDGTIVAFEWKQTRGTPVELEGADSEIAQFTAPVPDKAGILEFTLTVRDDLGLIGTDTVEVLIMGTAQSSAGESTRDKLKIDSCFISELSLFF